MAECREKDKEGGFPLPGEIPKPENGSRSGTTDDCRTLENDLREFTNQLVEEMLDLNSELSNTEDLILRVLKDCEVHRQRLLRINGDCCRLRRRRRPSSERAVKA